MASSDPVAQNPFNHMSAVKAEGVGEQSIRWHELRESLNLLMVPSTLTTCISHLARIPSLRWMHGNVQLFTSDLSIAYLIAASPRYGISRPFNFFGYVDTADMDFLASELAKAATHNHTFVMSHYPTATMIFGKTSDGRTFWELSKHISVWLCGHLHRLFAGLGKTM